MEESSPSKNDDKQFSVLNRYKQLKKEQEQPTENKSSEGNTPKVSSTEFQASTSSPNNEGRFSRKRRIYDNFERPSKRVTGDDRGRGPTEIDCGITEFLRKGPGFNVILKNRFTDFQVNEIDYEGNIVRLTSTELVVPSAGEPEALSDDEEEDPTILSPEKWDALRNIVDNKLLTTLDLDVTDMNKEERLRIHKAVKKRHGIHIYSNTKEIDGKKMMQIGFSAQAHERRYRWPRERPEFLHFVLFKVNADMSEAISTLSKFTYCKSTKFGYAGTKDKRASTSQWACLRRGEVEMFKNCGKMRGMAVGNFCYKRKNLRLGDLKGNRFKLALRNVTVDDELIHDSVEHFKTTGFINYFGLQRFGSSSLVPTYAVGKAILNGDWKLAVELILKPRPGEPTFRDVMEAREIWWTSRNATDALKPLLRKDKSIEGKLLVALRKHGPNAYQNAIDSLPRHIGTMYLHSYQSLIWNRVVSRRIKEFGLQVLPGDLVKLSSEAVKDECQQAEEENDDNIEEDDELKELGEGRIQVRTLSEEEAAEASIYDVLYPLPGDDIRMPANQVAEWYNELLQADGYSMSSFGKVHKKYGMYGSYRLMLERAGDVSWHTLRYSEPDQDLLQTDFDALKNMPPPSVDPEGPYKALVLEFSLTVCCYATMAVRELTKCDTSTTSQALLSLQARNEDKKRQENCMQNGSCDMEAESQQQTDEPQQGMEAQQQVDEPQQGMEAQQQVDEQGDMIKREAEADNIINKYLEINYH